MSRVGVILVALLAALALTSCYETAESYCGDLYTEGGVGTPKWAREAGYFSDRESCVEWYRANEPDHPWE